MDNPKKQSLDQSAQQPTVPPSNLSSFPHKSKTYLFILIAFVILLIIVGGVYLLEAKNTNQPKQTSIIPTTSQPSPSADEDPTTNWKTYTSSLDGYQLKYPANFMDCTNERVKGRFELRKTTICADGEGYSEIYISVIKQKGDYEKSDYPQCYTVKKEDVTIGGIKSTRYTDVQKPDPQNKCQIQSIAYATNNHQDNIILEHGGKIYHIWLPGNAFPDINKEKYQILSTFKFLDKSTNSSQWQSIKIIDGSVYGINNLGKQRLLIDKKSFNQDNQYGDYNYGIAEAYLSPDRSRVLLLFDGGITLYFLYYTNLDKIEVKNIGIAQEAAWSPNSRYIAYNSKPADAGGLVILKVYDTNLDKEVNISTTPNIKGLKYDYLDFSNIRWLEDSSGIKVHYGAYTGNNPFGEMISEGEVILPLKSR